MTDDPTTIEEQAEEPEKITVLAATEGLAAELMRIAKKTKMSETGVMNIYSFFIQQEERARMQAQQAALVAQQQGQAAVDAIANEVREADEVVTADE